MGIQKGRACGAANKVGVRPIFVKIVSTKNRSNVEITTSWCSNLILVCASSVTARIIHAWCAREGKTATLVFAWSAVLATQRSKTFKDTPSHGTMKESRKK